MPCLGCVQNLVRARELLQHRIELLTLELHHDILHLATGFFERQLQKQHGHAHRREAIAAENEAARPVEITKRGAAEEDLVQSLHGYYSLLQICKTRVLVVQADLFASTAQPVRKNKPDAFNAGSQAAAAAPVPKSAQSQMWDKLQVNKMVCFVMKGDNLANLRTAEVISLADDKRSGEFWFWIDGSGTYRSDKPFGQRRLTPEWADHRGRTRIKPKPDQQRGWS